MYWIEDESDRGSRIPDDVVDVVFSIACRTLPVDHAYALSQAVVRRLPWLPTEAGAGIHPIHVAESAHGWMRPEMGDDLLHLSRRTRLVLRVPAQRLADTDALVGQVLDVAGHPLAVKARANVRYLSDITTIFSRYVVAGGNGDEQAFTADVVAQLRALGIEPRKLLPGKMKRISTPQGLVTARSLMIAELSAEESIALQRHGLGPHHELGCGLFVAHKDIKHARQESR